MEHRKLSNVAAKSYFRGEERGYDRRVLALAAIGGATAVTIYGISCLQNYHERRTVPPLANCRYSEMAGYAICGKSAGPGTKGLTACERYGKTWICRTDPSPAEQAAETVKTLGL